MKLYYFPYTDNNRKVLAVIHHLGLSIELVEINLLKGEHLKPDYHKLNPNHKTPVLQDGDFLLWESNAIMQYLSSQKPDNNLWPASPRIQADIARWQFWQATHWGPPCGVMNFQRLIKPLIGETPNEAAIEKARKDFATNAEVLNQHLRDRRWLVGDNITLADLAVGAPLNFAQAAQIPLEPYSEIRRWYADLEQWDAWKKSAPPPLNK